MSMALIGLPVPVCFFLARSVCRNRHPVLGTAPIDRDDEKAALVSLLERS